MKGSYVGSAVRAAPIEGGLGESADAVGAPIEGGSWYAVVVVGTIIGGGPELEEDPLEKEK